MEVKSIRYVDDLGRIILPADVRKSLNLQAGENVTVYLDDDGAIRIKADSAHCAVCGTITDDISTVSSHGKEICVHCAMEISQRLHALKAKDGKAE